MHSPANNFIFIEPAPLSGTIIWFHYTGDMEIGAIGS